MSSTTTFSTNYSGPWTKLASITEDIECAKILFDRKSMTFVVVPRIILNNVQKANIILKYKFSKNLWDTYKIQSPDNLLSIDWNDYLTLPLSKWIIPEAITGNTIFATTALGKFEILEIMDTTNEFKIKTIPNLNKSHKSPLFGASLFINAELHHIAENHIIYNTDTKKVETFPAPTQKSYYKGNLIQANGKLLLFGGTNNEHPDDRIYQYDIKKKYWQCLSIKLPNPIGYVSCASISNEQIIIISGTAYNRNTKRRISNNIYIYEVKTEIIKKSAIKCPPIGSQIFAINDNKKDLLLTCSWIKNECQNSNLYLPKSLNAMIVQYYINEFVHAFNANGELYRIDVFEIINNCY